MRRYLDCPSGDARLDLLAEQLVRHAVVMLGDLDVIIEAGLFTAGNLTTKILDL